MDSQHGEEAAGQAGCGHVDEDDQQERGLYGEAEAGQYSNSLSGDPGSGGGGGSEGDSGSGEDAAGASGEHSPADRRSTSPAAQNGPDGQQAASRWGCLELSGGSSSRYSGGIGGGGLQLASWLAQLMAHCRAREAAISHCLVPRAYCDPPASLQHPVEPQHATTCLTATSPPCDDDDDLLGLS